METPSDTAPHLADASRRLAQRALVICENRIELLMLEVQEERERFLRAVLLALGAAVEKLLAARRAPTFLPTLEAGAALERQR